jgi:hypothetical protein
MPVIIDGSQGLTFPDNSRQYNGYFGFKNRIINGDMRIDQRNAGASVTVNDAAKFYPVDRFFGLGQSADGVFTLQQSSTAPAGFTKSIIATVTTADASIGATQQYYISQRLEGFNTADFAWGTASAVAVTLSFWTRSSLTGTFGGALQNDAQDRSYPFTYTISAANTWEQKTINIAAITTGTWETTSNSGIRLYFDIGMGSTYLGTAGAWASADYRGATGQTNIIATNGATFYITGVQLEEGVVSTDFDVLPYGTQLQLCQRYYQRLYANNTQKFALARNPNTTEAYGVIPFYVPMRVAPSALEQSGTAANYSINHGLTVTTCSAVPAINTATLNNIEVYFTVASGLTAGQASVLRSVAPDQYLGWSAEL